MNSEIKYLKEMVMSLFIVVIFMGLKITAMQYHQDKLTELVILKTNVILQNNEISEQHFEIIMNNLKIIKQIKEAL